MLIDEFDFDLPRELIAQRPIEPRDAARLLRITASGLADRLVRELPLLLDPGDLLVFNDTKVVPARLAGMRGAVHMSITLHQAVGIDTWRVFAKPAKRLKPGDVIGFAAPHPNPPPGLGLVQAGQANPRTAREREQDKALSRVSGGGLGGGQGDLFTAVVLERRPEGDVVLRFDRGGAELMAALHAYGTMPLPPYIRGGVADERDFSDYQTLFAREEGAVAAPTAALHFTPKLMAALAMRGIATTTLTLHVGAGTFLPVKVADTDDHVMHEEIGVLTEETATVIARTRQQGGKIVAVGTTSLRLIESAAGADGVVRPFAGATALFITPGYRFKSVDRLLTNFHLPRSTLFMLVSAFAGLARMKAAYQHAKSARYRFYSYGDCCLLDREGA